MGATATVIKKPRITITVKQIVEAIPIYPEPMVSPL